MPSEGLEHRPGPVRSHPVLLPAATVALVLVAVVGFAVQGRISAPQRQPEAPPAAVPDQVAAATARPASPESDRRTGGAAVADRPASSISGHRPPAFWLTVSRGRRTPATITLRPARDGTFGTVLPLDPVESTSLVVDVLWSHPARPERRMEMATVRLALGQLIHEELPLDVARGSLILDPVVALPRPAPRYRGGVFDGAERWRYVLRVQGVPPWGLELRVIVTPARDERIAVAPEPRFWVTGRGGSDLGRIRELAGSGSTLTATVEMQAGVFRRPEARLVWTPGHGTETVPLVTVPLSAAPPGRGTVARDLATGSVSLRAGRWVDDAAIPPALGGVRPSEIRRYRLRLEADASALFIRAIVEPRVMRAELHSWSPALSQPSRR
jgi:hypothetical protein